MAKAKQATRKRAKGVQEYEETAESVGFWSGLREETRHSIIGIGLALFAVILFVAGFGQGGFLGAKLYEYIHYAFGVGYWVLPVLFLLLGVNFLRTGGHGLPTPALIAGPFFVVSALGLLAIVDAHSGVLGVGGAFGYYVYLGIRFLFGGIAAGVFLSAIFLVAILVLFDTPLQLGFVFNFFGRFKRKPKTEEWYETEDDGEPELVEGGEGMTVRLGKKNIAEQAPDEEEEVEVEDEPVVEEAVTEKPLVVNMHESGKTPNKNDGVPFTFDSALHGKYVPPPISLLAGDKGKAGFGDIKANANTIKSTLANFGIQVEMDEVSVGPSVTRYALKPAQGVRLSRITSLANDLELALAVSPIRIEAPIPGKSLVGIEIPNKQKATVGLGALLGDATFMNDPNPLFVALGRGISGAGQYMNVAKMPHMLVAGTTGSGKSVTMHTIITSLLYRNSPEQLRFIMVDPKRVELTLYNGIPHLLTPVITAAKKALLSLKWATKEMDRRLEVLEREKCRDIGSYHKNVLQPQLDRYEKRKLDGKALPGEEKELPELMPYIVIVIDELADLMMAFPKELEASIVRIAQLARATGIHLVIATQRPSVNVITGLIKANIPGRIAMQVASQIDSRTIIDEAGAEVLLGQGDMLYISSSSPKPTRLQSAFISEDEVKKVVKFLKENYDGTMGEELAIGTQNPDGANSLVDGIPEDMLSGSIDSGDDDEKFEEAKKVVVESGKASTSFLQRRMGLGYSRAARIIDMMEQRGIIGPADGAKPRAILITVDDL
ncbi:MAG TPA: DNA translocase FtsK 4TM domain-containing protein [Candidatus Paceibacterota bacterium]|nr:DNA translocase FtsK 4TM domain-containing protein [Candidatus Paceibacterota bacterium]